MSFKFKKFPTFIASVTVHAPGGAEQVLRVTFKHKRQKEAAEWLKSCDGDGRRAALLEVIADWEAEDFPFNEDNLDELMQEYPGAGQALAIGFYSSLYGNVIKN